MTYILATSQAATSAGRKECRTNTTPARTLVECRGELLANNKERRLSGVSATANGVSSSAVKNPSRFSPPWTYLTETSDSTKAWSSLVDAVKGVDDSMEIVELTDDCKYTCRIMSCVTCIVIHKLTNIYCNTLYYRSTCKDPN